MPNSLEIFFKLSLLLTLFLVEVLLESLPLLRNPLELSLSSTTSDIAFDNDDDMELFYNNYGLEPDEQPKSIQEKSIQPIQQKRKWSSFYKKYNKRGITNIHEDYLVQLDKLEY